MESEIHRHDREAMLADHLAVAERVRREVEEAEGVAAEKRRAFDRYLEYSGVEAQAQPPADAPLPQDEEAARLLVASARAAEDVRVASRARALRTLTKAREFAARVHSQTERERAALAELQERRGQVEREAEEILAEVVRVEAEMEERRGRVEREADEILAQARDEAVRVEAVMEERRGRVEREADEILARARDEADRIVAASVEERQRVRQLLTGALASLDSEAASAPESLVGDLSSRLHETKEPTVT